MPPPSQLPSVFCTDESIAVRAPDDFFSLCPRSQQVAYGADGVVSPSDLWTLTSAGTNFASQGVAANMVINLKVPGYAPGGGTGSLFAVESVTSNSVTLRRLGQPLHVGQPPSPATGASGITFECRTLYPQIEEVTYDLWQRYGIDPNTPDRQPGLIYDQREVRRLCVLEVLYDRYTDANRSKDSDYGAKIKQVDDEARDLRERVRIKWGTLGLSNEETSSFGGRCGR